MPLKITSAAQIASLNKWADSVDLRLKEHQATLQSHDKKLVDVTSSTSSTVLQLTGVSATQTPAKQQDRVFSNVSVNFQRNPNDTNYAKTRIHFVGYKGNTQPLLMAETADSPTNFLCEATGETVTLIAEPYGTNGKGAGIANAVRTTVTLGGVTTNPPAPTIAQNLIATVVGYQFAFNQVQLGSTQDVIDSYKIYQNTTNNSATAVVVRTFKHDQTNLGAPIVVEMAKGDGVTYYHWVSAVNTMGLESTLTPAQSGIVVPNKTTRGAVYVVNGITVSPPNIVSAPATSPNTLTVPGWMSVQCQSTLGADMVFEIFVPDVSNSNAGYIFRQDNRSGQYLNQILRVSSLSTPTYVNIGTQYLSANAARWGGWQDLEIFVGNNGYMAIWANGRLVIDANDTTYSPSGTIKYGNELNNGFRIGPGLALKTGSTFINTQGSISNFSPYTFSYASTTTSITWSWTAFTLYSLDSNSISIAAAGGANGNAVVFSGLTAGTTYYFAMYYDNGTGQIGVALSDQSAGKAAFSQQVAAQTINGDGHVPIQINRTAATPTSGTGSGGGGGGSISCFSPNTLVRTKCGDIAISLIRPGDEVLTARGTWRRVQFVTSRSYAGKMLDMGGGELTTMTHLTRKEGTWVPMSQYEFPTVVYEGTIHNLHVDTEPDDDGTSLDTEHSYTLSNGLTVHNVQTI